MLLGLIASILTFAGAPASAIPVGGGTITGFEVEGNQADDPNVTGIDWSTAQNVVKVVDATTPDTGFQGSASENDPTAWTCQDKAGGITPGKDNILAAAVNNRFSDVGAVVDLAFVRQDAQGNTHVNFELNQGATNYDCASKKFLLRQDGDLLIAFEFPGGAGQADVDGYVWDADLSTDGEWVPIPDTEFPPGAATASTNDGDIANTLFPTLGATLGNRLFGEASLDLLQIFPDLFEGDCVTFGTLNVRSRSSGESFTSALQDRLTPTPINLSTCGSITIHKQDDAGSPLAGATFGLYANATDAANRDNEVATCVSVANGNCVFGEVNPGSYYVAEISAPDGYDVDPDVVGPITVGFRQNVDVAAPFVDPRDTGFVVITKAIQGIANPPAGSMAGATFVLQQNGQTVQLWPEPDQVDDPATCTITGNATSCQIGPVPLGTYAVVETAAPTGTNIGPAIPAVVIDEDGETVQATYTNPPNPISIDLDKSGPEFADIGSTFTYTFAVTNTGQLPLGNITLVELNPDRCNVNGGAISGPVKTGGNQDEFLDPGTEVWTYTCQHLVTPADGTSLVNTARASGTDRFGRTVSDDDPHTVAIRYPDLNVVKTGNGTVNAGGTATFTITVTNQGSGPALNSTLTDNLPAGTWTLGGANAASCSINTVPNPDQLTCDFGTIAAAGTRTVTLSRTVTAADCGAIPNTATVATVYNPGATNIDTDGSDNSSTATINVTCPDVGVTKTGNGTIDAGEDAVFSIVVQNFGNGTATGVTLNDPLPSGITWSITSDTGAPACGIAGGTLSCPAFSLAPQASRTIVVTGTTDAADCGSLVNTVVITPGNGDTNPDNNTSTATVLVQCPDLTIVKTADDTVVDAGDPIGFSVTVGNDGPGEAKGVTLNDPLPAGPTWTIESVTGDVVPTCGIAAGTLTCSAVDLADGQDYTVHITATTSFAQCATYTNEATADATNDDPVDDDASITCRRPALAIDKVADQPTTVSAGDPIGFTVTVSNSNAAGTGTAKGVTLNDPLPGGLTWTIQSQSGGAGCQIAGATLSCGPIDLAPGASFSVHVVATTSAANCTQYLNTADAGGTNTGVRIEDSASVLCLQPGLNVVKLADDEVVDAGDDLGFSVEVINNLEPGGVAQDVTLDDPLPTGVEWTLDSVSGNGVAAPTCGISGAVDSQVLTCSAVDLDPGDSYLVHVSATTSFDDCATYDNTATATPANGDAVSDDALITCQLPDLTIDKVADDPATVDAGEDVGFTITVANGDDEGTATADAVTLEDPLPAGLDWSIESQSGGADCDIAGGTLACGPVDLAPGESFSVHIVATTAEGECSVYENTADAGGSNTGPRIEDTDTAACIDIELVKDGPDLAHVGDTVTYTFEVTNTGGIDLVTVVLDDPDCDAAATLVEDGDGDAVLAVGETWSYECDRLVEAGDPDPLPNLATVTGTDAGGSSTSDDDPHEVDLIAPAIQIVKTVDDATPDVGQTVTFSYAVTNTGDTTLFDVVVVDDRLGSIGTIEELAVGQTVTLTKTMVVAASSPTTNIGTATGSDVLGKTVTDDDPEVITINPTEVLPNVIERPQALPRTGAESRSLLVLAVGLLLVGFGLVLMDVRDGRRRPA